MCQYSHTKICFRGKNVSIPSYCVLLTSIFLDEDIEDMHSVKFDRINSGVLRKAI